MEPGLDCLRGGRNILILNFFPMKHVSFRVLSTRDHTSGHVAYLHEPTRFYSAEMLWPSLQRVSDCVREQIDIICPGHCAQLTENIHKNAAVFETTWSLADAGPYWVSDPSVVRGSEGQRRAPGGRPPTLLSRRSNADSCRRQVGITTGLGWASDREYSWEACGSRGFGIVTRRVSNLRRILWAATFRVSRYSERV